jgi:methyl-accepting chemotaxis protein
MLKNTERTSTVGSRFARRRSHCACSCETGSASAQVLWAGQSLSGDSNRLKLEVGKFLDSVRAA